MNLWINHTLNTIASFSAFANFVVNSVVAFIIWWHIYKNRIDEVSRRHDSFDDKMFALAGCGFTLLAITYLSIALARAGDISLTAWTASKIFADSGMLCVALYGAYQLTVDRYRFTVPIILLSIACLSSAVFVWVNN